MLTMRGKPLAFRVGSYRAFDPGILDRIFYERSRYGIAYTDFNHRPHSTQLVHNDDAYRRNGSK